MGAAALMKARPPCKVDGIDCQNRRVGCRADCTAWKEYAEAHKAEKDHEAEVKARASDVYDVEGKRWLREKKLVQSIREKERRRGQR